MKIMVLTEGGEKTGFGHISRCSALVHAAMDIDGATDAEFIVNGDERARRFLDRQGITGGALLDWNRERRNVVNAAKQKDMVIIDSYIADEFLYGSISDVTHGRMLMIDDYNRIKYPEGLVINPSICGSGKEYIILRREFWAVPDKKIKDGITDVLITFGGKGRELFMEKTLDALAGKYPRYNYHVVSPDGGRGPGGGCGGKIMFYGDIPASGMLDLMLMCDICVSGGGQTLYELARCGVPSIGICFAENQMGNISSLKKAGFLEWAGSHEKKDVFTKMRGCIEKLGPADIRRERYLTGKSIVDGKGAKRVIESFMKSKAGS
ncbi:MAG: hypothetical protein JW728_00865 [Candidatus Aureabacteria bacterium]|nr:hypothetical protein [Candidatus Auribacterota bacterium]